MSCREAICGIFRGLKEIHESLVTFFRDLHDFQVKCVRMLSDFFEESPEDSKTLGSMS